MSKEIKENRPINETEGLDFDPTPFIEVGQVYQRTGRYTAHKKGGKPYVDF